MKLDAGFAATVPGGWGHLALLVACLAGGAAAGLLYFRLLGWGLRLLSANRPVAWVLLLALARFGLLAALLYAVARQGGALPLLTAALGVLGGRRLALRGTGRAEGPAA